MLDGFIPLKEDGQLRNAAEEKGRQGDWNIRECLEKETFDLGILLPALQDLQRYNLDQT